MSFLIPKYCRKIPLIMQMTNLNVYSVLICLVTRKPEIIIPKTLKTDEIEETGTFTNDFTTDSLQIMNLDNC